MMHTYTAKEFNLPAELNGLSAKQIEVHLGLYNGYVTHVNKLNAEIVHAAKSDGDHSYTMHELNRRLGFEFNGMRMHEYYFEQLEGGAAELDMNTAFGAYLSEHMGGVEGLMGGLSMTAMSRGIGWTVAYWDAVSSSIVMAWVSDHEVGQLGGMPILFVLDMWEHAFMVDYTPAEKADYIKAYFSNVNWSVVAKRFEQLS